MPKLVMGERNIELDRLQERVSRAAAGLKALGIKRGDSVAIFMRNDIAFIEATLAAGRLGAYSVPVNWHSALQEVSYILSDCAAKVIVAHADLLSRLAATVPPGVTILIVDTPPEIMHAYGLDDISDGDYVRHWDHWLEGFAPLADGPVEMPSAIIYTSGTTGVPKGVRRPPLSGSETVEANRLLEMAYGLKPGSEETVVLVCAPLYHTAPNVHAFTALSMGASVIVQPRFDAEEMLQLIERWRITHVYLAPIMFNRLLRLPQDARDRYDLSSLRFVAHGAAPCPVDIKRAMIKWWGPILHEFYGSTEARAVTGCDSHEWLERPGTVGRALPGATVRVVDEDGRDQPPGIPGEIICGYRTMGDFTYTGDNGKREEIDRGGLIAIGDVGYLDETGYLFICDRIKELIISGGVNIYPAEIEAAISGAEDVFDSAVFGIPDPEFGESVMAVVQSASGKSLDWEKLKQFLRGKIAGYKIPKRFEQMDMLPRDESGKIFKRKLRQRYWEAADRMI